MTNIIAVIGAGYGDEGKGLFTDYFANQHNDSIICRSNGGAQAGHTVVTPNGIRHVFSHLGAGSFSDKPTFLSEHFICNPLLFKKEYIEFTKKHSNPSIYVHEDCLVTTPVDMIINQILEKRRAIDGNRHGSVGLGINETIERNTVGDFKLSVGGLTSKDLQTRLFHIKTNWIDLQLPTIMDHSDDELYLLMCLENNQLWLDYIETIEYFLEHVVVVSDYNTLNTFDTVIFEGAQGLMLDQDYGVFPHVTRSNTGVKNIIDILNHVDNIEAIEVVYVTRAYTTRHGAGPLLGEVDLPYNIIDETNITHEYQGAIRYAPLSFTVLYDAIYADFDQIGSAEHPYRERVIANVAITCLDQIKDTGIYYGFPGLCYNLYDDYFKPISLLERCSGQAYIDILLNHANYVSYGSTRNDIVINDPLLYLD